MNCQYCNKEYERPHGYRTEAEAFHVYGCELEDIKKQLQDKNISPIKKMLLIDNLEHISHVSSFGGNKKPYWDRMVECNKIIKELQK